MATSVLGLKTFVASDPVDYNEINDNYTKIDNGVKTAMQGRAAQNLLDNSDFSIAQDGQNGSHGSTKYVCDRWISWDANATFGNGYITPGSPIDQRFYLSNEQANKTHTAVLYMADGTVIYHFGKPIDSFGLYATVYCGVSDAATNLYMVRIGAGQNVKSAALYEGAYTADTLPAYVPKGYAAELAECQRYYQTIPALTHIPGVTNTSVSFGANYKIPTMRIAPTVSIASGQEVSIYTGDYSATTIGYTMQYASNPNQITLNITLSAGSFVAYKPGMLTFPVDIALSADL